MYQSFRAFESVGAVGTVELQFCEVCGVTLSKDCEQHGHGVKVPFPLPGESAADFRKRSRR